MAQPLFKADKDGLFVATIKVDDAVRLQSGLRERRREQIRPRDAPEHLTPRTCGNAGGEQPCRRPVHGAIAASGDFMQCTERQPAARQPPIDLADAKRQNDPGTASRSFDTLDVLTKFGNDGPCGMIRHDKTAAPQSSAGDSLLLCSIFVLIKSVSQSESHDAKKMQWIIDDRCPVFADDHGFSI